MKRRAFITAALIAGALSLLSAQEFTDSMVNHSLSWQGYDAREPLDDDTTPSRFFSVDGEYDYIGKSSFSTPEDAGQKISYQQGDLDFAFTQLFDECEGVSVGLGYTYSHIGWTENPFFSEADFNNIALNLNGFTKRFCNWDWRGGVGLCFNAREFGNWDYNLYNFTLWGRYNLCTERWPDMGIHIGFIGRSGIKQDKILPILGMDFKMSPCWKLNVVYPVNMSAIYALSDTWSLALTGKIWNTRNRVGRNEVLSRGIYEYRNAGAEVSINYNCGELITANVHVGSTLGVGDLKVANSQNRVVRHNKFRAAPYIGSGFSFKF